MPKLWKLKPKMPQELAEKYAQYDPLISQLLYNRDLKEKDRIEDFFNPKYEHLHDPFLFRDMQKAVDRIWQAIEKQEQIFIYGDYDADAVTANAVMQQTFRYLGVEGVKSYIPSRFAEGYGLNIEAFEKIKAAGGQLVITVDCGTNSKDAAEFCKQNNIDLIITDHHEILDGEPDCVALINPKNPKDNYPEPNITGVGVAFKLAQALLTRIHRIYERNDTVIRRVAPSNDWGESTNVNESTNARVVGTGLDLPLQGDANRKTSKINPDWAKWLLDLVAIGTVADCHSLLGENRILVKYGLQVLTKSRWAGLRALCRAAVLDFVQRPADTYTLGFVIAPRLNAAGRLEHADIALHLLVENDPIVAQERAFALEELNRKRQDLTAQLLSEIKDKIINIKDRKVLVLFAENLPKGRGVVGLVAGKVAEEFGKPAIVLERQDGESTGSARTVGEFNMLEALKYAAEHLTRFGGHKQAAGLTLKTSEYEQFYQKILEYADKTLSEEDLQRKLMLEAELLSANLTVDTLERIEQFAPFGVSNPRPKFLISDCKIINFREVGNNQKHLQINLEKNNTTVASIAFGFGYFAKNLKIGDTIDVAAELIEDGWNGRRSVKLRIVDIRNSSM